MHCLGEWSFKRSLQFQHSYEINITLQTTVPRLKMWPVVQDSVTAAFFHLVQFIDSRRACRLTVHDGLLFLLFGLFEETDECSFICTVHSALCFF